MSGSIWVLAEHWRGQLSESTYELLALGREIADGLGVELQAVLLGHGAADLAKGLGKANSVLSVDHSSLCEPVPEACAAALVQLIKERRPRSVLVPLTNISMGVGTLVSTAVKVPAANFCRDVRVVDGGLQATCVLYGGKIEATVTMGAECSILGIWPGARAAENGRSDVVPPVEPVTVSLPEAPRVRFKRYIEPEAGDVDITQQDTLVAVGRGMQGQANLALAEELAEVLGGAVCGSRPVIDQGWLPLSRQVGKSGVSVKPKLYLAAGISGAPEHVEGMKNAALIIAVNTDPRAPIFNVAHYGILADALEVLPALTEAVRGKKG